MPKEIKKTWKKTYVVNVIQQSATGVSVFDSKKLETSRNIRLPRTPHHIWCKWHWWPLAQGSIPPEKSTTFTKKCKTCRNLPNLQKLTNHSNIIPIFTSLKLLIKFLASNPSNQNRECASSHTRHIEVPKEVAKCPGLQNSQLDDPNLRLKFPIAHGRQLVLPTSRRNRRNCWKNLDEIPMISLFFFANIERFGL